MTALSFVWIHPYSQKQWMWHILYLKIKNSYLFWSGKGNSWEWRHDGSWCHKDLILRFSLVKIVTKITSLYFQVLSSQNCLYRHQWLNWHICDDAIEPVQRIEFWTFSGRSGEMASVKLIAITKQLFHELKYN